MSRELMLDQNECIGCESCVDLCSDVFGFNAGDEKAYIIQYEEDSDNCIEDAIESCPSECIYWEED